MAIPDIQSIMLPLLRLVGDGQEHGYSEVVDILGRELNLKEEDKKEMLGGGRRTRFESRIITARNYLQRACIIESAGWGRFRITERGLEVLKNNPAKINVKFLQQFSEFRQSQAIPVQNNHSDADIEDGEKATPQEVLEEAYQLVKGQLAQDLLDRVKTASPKFFEQLVVDLLVAMGYGGSRKDAGRAIGQTGDGGIDGIIKEDRLGLDVIYIQAKRWEETVVGRKEIQSFAGALMGNKARKGVFITTSTFSQPAKQFTAGGDLKIILIDGSQLAQYMIDYNVGVAEESTYTIKKIDIDYFSEE